MFIYNQKGVMFKIVLGFFYLNSYFSGMKRFPNISNGIFSFSTPHRDNIVHAGSHISIHPYWCSVKCHLESCMFLRWILLVIVYFAKFLGRIGRIHSNWNENCLRCSGTAQKPRLKHIMQLLLKEQHLCSQWT